MATLSQETIRSMNFGSIGKNVSISSNASFYGIERIHIGNDVRIDDFCVISAGSGGIYLGNNIHIAVYTSLIGAGKITISDFCNISSRVSIYSSNDDYSGKTLTNPTIPKEFTNVTHSDVRLEKHVIVGCGSVILPGVVLEQGAAVGALSLVKENCSSFCIYAGNPAKLIGKRKRDLLEIENKFIQYRGAH